MSLQYADNILPSATGFDLGSASQEWDLFAQNIDCSGTASFTGTLAITQLEDIQFADQAAGATVTDKIDTALAAATTVVVLVPSSMGAGNATAIATGKSILDYRAGYPKVFTNYSVSAPAWQVNDSGVTIMAAIASSSSNVASAGQVRLASTDTIKFRNNANGGDIIGLSKNASDVVQLGDTAGGKVNGPLTIAGALAGCTTGAFSNQITSTLATGTAPLVIASTTLVSNLNVATINGVTVSGAASAGQVLTASSASAASWAGATPAGYTYSASNKRWELFDSTITTWLQDVQPGWKVRADFGTITMEDVAAAPTSVAAGNHAFKLVYAGGSVLSRDGGNLRLTTNAVGGSVAYATSGGTSGAALAPFFDIDISRVQSFWFIIDPVQSDANTQHRVGFWDSITDPPTSGIYLEKLTTDANWFLVTRNGGVQTRNTTGVAHAVGPIGFIVVKNGTTDCKVYQAGSSTALATNTTNIPASGNHSIFAHVATATGAGKSIQIYALNATGKSAITGY